MLVLSRLFAKHEEDENDPRTKITLTINPEDFAGRGPFIIEVQLVEIQKGRWGRIGIAAPRSVNIVRNEVIGQEGS